MGQRVGEPRAPCTAPPSSDLWIPGEAAELGCTSGREGDRRAVGSLKLQGFGTRMALGWLQA